MSEKLFRKASIERVNSPEQLNEYIRVARPGVWVLLSAIVLMLIGVVFWGVYGNIETSFRVPVAVKDGVATIYITPDEAPYVHKDMQVRIGENMGKVVALSEAAERFDVLTNGELADAGIFEPGDVCHTATVDITGVPDGVYSATVIEDQLKPIEFVIR